MTELKPKRTRGWFKVENEFFDTYARDLGATYASVYLCLKRHMNSVDKVAFPSESLLAEKLGLHRRTVNKAIKVLIARGFIEKRKERYKGLWPHNVYTFPEKSNWQTTTNHVIKSAHGTKGLWPWDSGYIEPGTKSHTNNTNYKNTNNKKSVNLSTYKSNGP
jgi:DNA-binding transcriptional MocR family regulator